MIPHDGEKLGAIADLWRRSEKRFSARFEGRSMRPSIQPAALLTVNCARSDLREGDVVAFLQDGAVIVHRVVLLRGGVVFTRGDGNVLPDRPVVNGADVIGIIEAADGSPVPAYSPNLRQRLAMALLAGVAGLSVPLSSRLLGRLIAARRALVRAVIAARRSQST